MRRPQAIGRLGELDDGFEPLNRVLNSGREPRVELALDLLQKTSYNKYLNLASTQARRTVPGVDRDGRRVWKLPTGDPSGSLEDLHNFYHGATGGQGHMARVPVAAFDPIFWLHHWYVTP
jgi:tyrosinase